MQPTSEIKSDYFRFLILRLRSGQVFDFRSVSCQSAIGNGKSKMFFVLCVFVAMEIFSAGIDCHAGENDWFKYLGTKEAKKAPRKSMNAAEALPPLPLPATPLRRTERKKPPQPDYLVGKVIWGESASFVDTTGKALEIADWNLCPTDTQKFVENSRAMDLTYHWQNTNLNDFHFDPKKLPALLFSGVRTLKLSDYKSKRLRYEEYVSHRRMWVYRDQFYQVSPGRI